MFLLNNLRISNGETVIRRYFGKNKKEEEQEEQEEKEERSSFGIRS